MEYFLRLEGFNGKSYDARHLGEIEIDSVKYDKSYKADEVYILKKSDEDTAKILTAIADGQVFSSGKITSVTLRDKLGFEMRNVEISSYQSTGDGNFENITLRFESRN